MTVKLTDQEIADLISERKPLPTDFAERLNSFKDKYNHRESELEVTGVKRSKFIIIIRQNKSNPFDFSVILAFRIPGSNVIFRLRRYNGKSHRHRNKIENALLNRTYHVHNATERYQQNGFKEEDFATETDRYADINGALMCLLQECNFTNPNGNWLTKYI